MDLNSLTGMAGVGALIAAVTAGWSYIKMVLQWAVDLLICRTSVTEETANAVLAYCWHNGKRSRFGIRVFGGCTSWVQPKRRSQLVAYETIGSDPALGVVTDGRSSRPGRIDRVITLGYMLEPKRLALASHILSDFQDEISDAVSKGDGMTPAQFQDYCAQIALHRFWDDKKSTQ